MHSSLIPTVSAEPSFYGGTATRDGVINRKNSLIKSRKSFSNKNCSDFSYKKNQDSILEEDFLEDILKSKFIPQHSSLQLISPRAFFVSPLFRVCSKTIEREKFIELNLLFDSNNHPSLAYSGPELRQSDGLVFMSLLNISRDFSVGNSVSFSVEELCKTIFGRYDGPARARLKEHIQRLQRALIKFEKFSVQLCQRFDYPSKGQWTVAMDTQIISLFKQSPYVWLDLNKRVAMPEGLTSWLYSFIESQSKLIPVKVDTLKSLCGSEACSKAFCNKLRDSLKILVQFNVIEPDWKINKGVLRWMKSSNT